MLQRYGLPEPRVAAAAAAASGPAALPPPPPLRGAGRRRSRSRRRAGGAGTLVPSVDASIDGATAGDGELLSPIASAATASELLGDGPSASSLAAAAVPLKQPGSGAATAAASTAANAAAAAALSYNSSYGAGMTRYRRWSMYQIDPAAENPDYWQVRSPVRVGCIDCRHGYSLSSTVTVFVPRGITLLVVTSARIHDAHLRAMI